MWPTRIQDRTAVVGTSNAVGKRTTLKPSGKQKQVPARAGYALWSFGCVGCGQIAVAACCFVTLTRTSPRQEELLFTLGEVNFENDSWWITNLKWKPRMSGLKLKTYLNLRDVKWEEGRMGTCTKRNGKTRKFPARLMDFCVHVVCFLGAWTVIKAKIHCKCYPVSHSHLFSVFDVTLTDCWVHLKATLINRVNFLLIFYFFLSCRISLRLPTEVLNCNVLIYHALC